MQALNTTTEGEGFEPSSEESPPKRFSRPPHSTALPPLQGLDRRTSVILDAYAIWDGSGKRVRLRRSRPPLAARGEEAAQQLAACWRQQAPGDLRSVIQAGLSEHVEHTSAGAGLRIASAVYDARRARQHDRARAHRAWLERDVQA